MEQGKKTIVTTRTVRVEFSEEAVHGMLRRAANAPERATVLLDNTYGHFDAAVSWSEASSEDAE